MSLTFQKPLTTLVNKFCACTNQWLSLTSRLTFLKIIKPPDQEIVQFLVAQKNDFVWWILILRNGRAGSLGIRFVNFLSYIKWFDTTICDSKMAECSVRGLLLWSLHKLQQTWTKNWPLIAVQLLSRCFFFPSKTNDVGICDPTDRFTALVRFEYNLWTN